MEMKWFEQLPAGCPPNDALECDGIFYRIANANPAVHSDFFSQRKMFPNKVFADVDECIVRSLSVFNNLESTKQRLKLPKFRKAHIAMVSLVNTDGKIKKTFGESHYSWWRSADFDVTKAKVIL